MKDSSDTHPNHLPDSSYGLFIDNQWVSDEYGETLDIINPANGKILTNIPNATAADVDRALQAAQRAFELTQEEAEEWYRGRDVYPQTAPQQDEAIVTFQGVPLGLAKRVGSRLKNSYPRELVRDGKLFAGKV